MNNNVFCLDKLKICFRAPIELVNDIESFGGLTIKPFRFVKNPLSKSKMRVSVFLPNAKEPYKSVNFGEFVFETTERYDLPGECFGWFKVANRFLYENPSKYSLGKAMHKLEECCGLELNNITECEVACDVPYKASNRIFKVLREHKNSIILLNREVKDFSERNDKIRYDFTGSFDTFESLNIYIQGKDNKFQFCVYNKKKEALVHDKEYILKHHKVAHNELYRMEVRFDKDHANRLIDELHTNLSDFLDTYIYNKNKLEIVWRMLSRKFIRIKKNRRHIQDILETIENEEELSLQVLELSSLMRTMSKSDIVQAYILAMGGGNAIPLSHNGNDTIGQSAAISSYYKGLSRAPQADGVESPMMSKGSGRPSSHKGRRKVSYRRKKNRCDSPVMSPIRNQARRT